MSGATISVLVTLTILAASCATDDAGAPVDATTPRAEEPADAPSAGESPGTGPAVEVDPADSEPAAEVELAMFSFAPQAIEIEAGDTVAWTNGDATRHTVTAGVDAEPTGAFHLTFDDRGDTAALTFTEPGEYRYFCTPHPFMQGTVTVSG